MTKSRRALSMLQPLRVHQTSICQKCNHSSTECSECQRRIQELALDYKANAGSCNYHRAFVHRGGRRNVPPVGHDRHEGTPDSPAPKSILAARQAALNSGCAGAAPHENGGRCCCRCYSSWVVRHHGATCLDYSTQWPGVQPQAALSF